MEDAIRDWLEHGLVGREESTVDNITDLSEHHIIPSLGRRRLQELTADDVDTWLAREASVSAHSMVSKLVSVVREPSTDRWPGTGSSAT